VVARSQKKLTKRVVDALRPDAKGRDMIYFDSEIPRFGVRVKPSGVKSYVLPYRNKFGQARRTTLGRVGDLTPDHAREKALILRGEIAQGADPSAKKRADRNALTVAELCDEYLTAGKSRIKERTLAMDRSRIACHVKPLLGSRAVASLKAADMEKFLHDVMEGRTAGKAVERAKGGPGVASRTLVMLRTILQRAVRDGILPANPVSGIERPKEQRKKPPFDFENVTILGTAMRELQATGENTSGLRAIRFLLLTGCRRGEALGLTWEMVDRRARCIRFADTKSGPQTRPIGRAALELLASFAPLDAKALGYVFPGTREGRYYVGLPDCWERVAKKAALKGVSLHGLRHWFASAAAEMNFSELTIAGLLGHRVSGVTARYATAPDSALLAAADRVSLRLAETLDGNGAAAKVVCISA
jgi:integrase